MEKRVYKFRAWSKEANKMYLWSSIKRLGNLQKLMSLSFVDVMQFTGLTDRNGVDIYEGDHLLVCAGYHCTVEFAGGMFVTVYNHPEDGEVCTLLEVLTTDTIVVGNIYEGTTATPTGEYVGE